ncbi:hypothetical protein IHE31_10870 [Mycetohabitans rhizoxinica]
MALVVARWARGAWCVVRDVERQLDGLAQQSRAALKELIGPAVRRR